MSNGQKEAVKGKVSKSNREKVIAQDFTGKFTLHIQNRLEVAPTALCPNKTSPSNHSLGP